MKLDIATLSFILCTTSIIQVIGIYFEGKINNFMLIILSNMSLVLAQILIYIGIVRFFKTKVKTGIIFFIFLISTLSFLYLTYINDNITWRTIISSIVMAANSFLITFELLKYKKESIRSSVVFLGLIMKVI